MIRKSNARTLSTLAVCAYSAMLAPTAFAEECQNQLDIDVCRGLCSATSATCGALCNFTSGVCQLGCDAAFGACDVGCDLCDAGCEACCCDICVICSCSDCEDDCDDCHDSCNGARSSCESGCRLECNNCILDCEGGCPACVPFRTVGEPCLPLFDRCADGLVCWPFPMPGDTTTRCFPSEDDTLFSEEECLDLYSPGVHQTAIDIGDALTFGRGSGIAAVVGATFELGVLYGEDGRYGCYGTTCIGGESNVTINTYVGAGLYRSYSDVPGQSIAIVEGAGEIISFSTLQILNTDGELIGTADFLALEVSLLPIGVGVYDCATIVDTVGMRDPITGELSPITNSPPVALCSDNEACADPESCTADASIDAGSFDPDGESVILSQSPEGPYEIGSHLLVLTVSDPSGESDGCTGELSVEDCDPPLITCPLPVSAECESDGQALVDPGDATATDCSAVTVSDPGGSSYPLGTTEVEYTATDSAGLESSCTTAVTVVDSTDPEILELATSPKSLWPPNKRMRRVNVSVVAEDACGEVTCTIVSVETDEPDGRRKGSNDGMRDINILDALVVELRADRAGSGDGRTYTITVECADGSGNTSQAEVAVSVPHDQRSNQR